MVDVETFALSFRLSPVVKRAKDWISRTSIVRKLKYPTKILKFRSDAGLKTYRQYWYGTIMSFLREKIYNKEKIDLIELKEEKGIDIRDILETLIISDMTFILDNNLHINVVHSTLIVIYLFDYFKEIPLYTMLSSLRRRYVKPKLLQVKSYAGPFTTYNL